MMMGDENGAHVSNVEPSLGDAAGHTITSIDNIKRVIDDQQI
jgi:hypothetical protein